MYVEYYRRFVKITNPFTNCFKEGKKMEHTPKKLIFFVMLINILGIWYVFKTAIMDTKNGNLKKSTIKSHNLRFLFFQNELNKLINIGTYDKNSDENDS